MWCRGESGGAANHFCGQGGTFVNVHREACVVLCALLELACCWLYIFACSCDGFVFVDEKLRCAWEQIVYVAICWDICREEGA
jgi:hypothetical protein